MTPQKKIGVPKDYRVYKPTLMETVLSSAALAALGYVVVLVFYNSPLIALVGLAAGAFGPKAYGVWRVNKRAAELNVQFRDLLNALNSSVSAGKPLNEAIRSAQSDMRILYMDENALINRELDLMVARLSVYMSVQDVLTDFGERSGNENIQSFAMVLRNGLDAGINQATLIQKTINVLSEKMEIQQEIQTKIAGIQMQQKIMAAMPVFMLLMIKLMSPDYLDPLYESPVGYIVVTVAVVLLIGAEFVSNKITNIKV